MNQTHLTLHVSKELSGKRGVFCIIPKAVVGTAVQRNVIKRWVRESSKKLGISTIKVRVSKGKAPLTYHETYKTIEKALR
jgi:ribonuclease P protein component